MTHARASARLPLMPWLFFAAFAVGCFLFIQLNLRFYYAFMEQYALFQTRLPFFVDLLRQPGGVNEYLARFLMQAFYFNGGAALVFTALLTLLAYSFYRYLRRLGVAGARVVSVVPSFLFLFFPVESIAPLLTAVGALLAALVYTRVKGVWRLVAGLLLLALSYFLAAPANLLLALLLCLYEILAVRDERSKGLSLLWLVWGGSLPFLGRLLFYVVPLREAFLSRYLYHPEYPVPFSFWLVGLSFPLLTVLFYALRHKRLPGSDRARAIASVVALLCVMGLLIVQGKNPLEQAYRYDYYARTQQWDAIVAHALRVGIHDKDALVYTNLALSKSGRFNEHLLQLPQIGEQGLIPRDPKSRMGLIQASEVAWHLNHINSAQRFAFVGVLSAQRSVQPRLMQRLVETYLVNEEYAAAEKYIKILESVPLYRRWATEQRRWLDPEKAATEPRIAEKRALRAVTDNPYDLTLSFATALAYMLDDHPHNSAAFAYAMGYLLIQKDFGTFVPYMERLRDSGEPLPKLYQEALCVIYATYQDPEAFRSYAIDPAIYNRFLAFLKTSRSTPPAVLKQQYGDAYYYYAQFVPAPKP